MNLDLILAFGKSGALNVEIDESEEQAKFGFPVAAVTACRANFEKSYLPPCKVKYGLQNRVSTNSLLLL